MIGAHIRQATVRDVEALSVLLAQLYAHELPGMLRGDVRSQVEAARLILASAPLGCRYVLERDGEIVGMGSLATQEEPRPKTPARVLLRAPDVMGPVNGVRTIVAAARALLGIVGAPGADQAQIHSVVVDPVCRGQGFGTAILMRLEEEAVCRGKQGAMLQVIASNTTARSFYRSAGYVEAEMRRGPIRRAVVFPSVIMRKDFTNR